MTRNLNLAPGKPVKYRGIKAWFEIRDDPDTLDHVIIDLCYSKPGQTTGHSLAFSKYVRVDDIA